MPEAPGPANAHPPKDPTVRVPRWARVQQKAEAFLLSAGILGIAGLMVANVICRRFFGFSLAAGEEITQFLIIMVCFVGLSYAAAQRRHIRMTALVDQLGRRARQRVELFTSWSTALLLLALCVWSVRYVMIMADLGSVSPVLRVPLFVIYAVAPLGFLSSAVHYGLQGAQWLMGRDPASLNEQSPTPDV